MRDDSAWQPVHRLLCDYLEAVDSADLERLVDLLAEAAVVTPGGTVVGRDRIREVYGRLAQPPHPDGRRRTKHHLTNLRVSGPEADGVVVADASYFVLDAGPEGPRVQKSGRFRDRVEQRGDRWVLLEHRVVPDL